MKAAIFKSKGVIAVEERPKPTISEPTDAIVRVVLACVCGSDLWFYRGIPALPHGGVGREFIGVVDAIGADVNGPAVGDFVISPFSWSDGTCKNCEAGFHTGAERIILLGSTHQDRHQLAREWGATDIIDVRGDQAVQAVHDLTDGYGADAVLE